MEKATQNIIRKFLCRVDTAFVLLMALFVCSCTGQQYSSKKQSYGEEMLSAKKHDEAIEAFKEAVKLAGTEKNAQEIAHLKSLLGWTYAETMRFDDAERELNEAVKIAEANRLDPALFYARLAVICSKAGSYEEGLNAAEKALALTADKWKSKAGTEDRDRLIDYAVKHHGWPPDVDMIKTITMAESAFSVLYLVKGDNQKSAEWGEKGVGHLDELSLLISLASSGEKREFYRGMGVAAAAASRAYRNLGNYSKEQAFLKIAIDAFKKLNVEVKGDDLLSAYAESGGYVSLARLTGGAFKPDPGYSRDFNEAEKFYFYGDYRNAIPAYKKVIENAKAKGNNDEAAKALGQLGWLLAEIGRYPEAIRLMLDGISNSPREDFSAVTYARLSAIEGRLGNYEKGLEYADTGLNIIYEKRKIFFEGKDRDSLIDAAMKNPGLPPDIVLIKAVMSAEGARVTNYYLKGDFREAIREGERAMRHFSDLVKAITLAPEREQISYFEGQGFVALTLGDSYLNIGKIKTGRDYIERSRDYFKKARLNFGDVIAEGLIGYSFIQEGDYKTGAEIFRKNLERIEKGGLEELKWHIRSRFAKAVYAEARLLESGMDSLSSVTDPVEGEKIKKEMLERNKQKTEVLSSLIDKDAAIKFSGIIKRLEETKDREAMLINIKSLVRFLKEEAYKNYLGAIGNIESLRSMLETDMNKRLFQANKQAIYSDFIEFSTELYGAEKGFEALERAKARGLMDLLASKEIAFKKGELLDEEKDSREAASMLILESKQKKTDDKAVAEVQKGIERYRSVILKIKSREPELSSLVSASYLKFDDIKKSLAGDTVLIEYYFTDALLYIWVLDMKGIEVVIRKNERSRLVSKVRDFRSAITSRDEEREKTLARELYDILIAPVRGKLIGKRLGIIPHDILHYVPFNALNSGEKYLIEEYPVFFSPSASVFKYAFDKARLKGSRVIAFGNPDLGESAYNLPYAQKEVESIAVLYPGTKIYTGKEAVKRIARNETAGYDILHFATHAEFSEIDPLYSSIRLAREGKDDGRLDVTEIFSMDINPYLVTLSACETGLGAVTSGDEIIGMNRAFIYAGAPSVISSLWSVSDISTAQLMEAFYRGLKTMQKDEAMQKAQTDMLKTKDFNDPFFWSPFYLTGAWK